jgi:hypothetical protein
MSAGLIDNSDVASIQVLIRNGHCDRIYINLTEEAARRIHGPYYDVWKGASFQMEVTKGRWQDALRALDLLDFPTEVINVP